MGKLISVIIPAFNEEKTIGGCLKSLKNQSYKQMEIIVVDDGSSDSTRNIVKGFSDIKLLTQSHKGPGQARNLGASNAKGEILIFVDVPAIRPDIIFIFNHFIFGKCPDCFFVNNRFD